MATEVILPEVGEGIESGTVVTVLVKQGDTVRKNQPLIELETDKAVVEVPSNSDGVVKQVNVKEGQEAKIGSVLVVLEDQEVGEDSPAAAPAEADAAAAKDGAPAATAARQAESTAAAAPAPATPPAAASKAAPAHAATGAGDASGNGRLVPAAPSVRRLARELGVDIRGVSGSGILGRVSAADVRASGAGAGVAPAAPAAQPLPDFSRYGEVERVPMSGVRKATLRAMANAWAVVPMVTHFDKADVTELEKFRKRHQKQMPEGVKLTPTAILLKIVGAALRRFPDFNASIDAANLEVVRKHYVNIGVAVDTDAGLLVPVVRGVDRKSLVDLARELGELAAKARDRKLTLEEMQGGNFSISNLGGIGGHAFTPIVTPPEVAILGVSRSAVEGVWNEDTGAFEPRTMMPLALTYDHRLIDGASAARFLRWLCQAMEEPFAMALDA